ncbi:MAG: MBL fold metallo-hydrolase [Planctomycetota bacterium]
MTTEVHHLDCGRLESPLGPACCHCLAIVSGHCVALVDSGIGLLDCADPEARLGRELIDLAGFRFDPELAAVRLLASRGISPERVTDIVLTHADPDHTGGLADFPGATVHLAAEELEAVRSGAPRYVAAHFEHSPRWQANTPSNTELFDVPVRPVTVCGDVPLYLVELFGHTAGHCGVLIPQRDRWLLHAGDAYYLAAELDSEPHPVDAMAEAAAEDDAARRASLDSVRRLRSEHGDKLDITGYHDTAEFERYAALA